MRTKLILKVSAIAALVIGLSGCETMSETIKEAAAAVPNNPKVVAPLEPKMVRATGYAPISLQPGRTREQKMIVAMRASKLRAYQELAAIVHGQYLFGTTRVQDMVIQSDSFKTAVAGIVRGAQVIKTFPLQNDTYATTLAVDLNQVQRAWVDGEAVEGNQPAQMVGDDSGATDFY